MDYNTQREKLVLPEYGRIIQSMVKYAVSLPNKADRQACAQKIIELMAQISPNSHQASDFQQTLWDHLALISDYKLDIDWPYEIERPDEIQRPNPMSYPMTKIKFRHYGHLLEDLLEQLKTMEPGEQRDKLTLLVANQMRKDLFYWNKTSLNEKKIAADMDYLTNGTVRLEEGQVNFSQAIPSGNNTRTASIRRIGGRARGRR